MASRSGERANNSRGENRVSRREIPRVHTCESRVEVPGQTKSSAMAS